MPASHLIERVAELITSGEQLVPEEMMPALDGLKRRIREPVRVAVVGPVNAGKSTIVNALLGQRVAPTDVSECTRLVSWFRYGHPQRIEIQLKDGTSVAAQLGSDGSLPSQLPVPIDQVQALHCFLANDALRTLTLIDTPGIGSVHGEISQSTTELLSAARDTTEATHHADAVVFLFSQAVMQDQLETLQLFRGSSGSESQRSAANAVGVLSKADQLGDGTRDSWHLALELASNYAGKFREEVATVVPVIGLIAETSETASLTETDVNGLAGLAAMDEKQFGRLLWSGDRFVSADAPVSGPHRERLLELLDLYGITQAVRFLREGTQGAVALRRELTALSGIGQVKLTLETYFREQDHVLKVRSALDLLGRLTYSPDLDADGPGLRKFRGEIEALRLEPVMHPVAELEVWHDCCTGRVSFPDDTMEEIGRLFAPGTTASKLATPSNDRNLMLEAAKEGMIRWQKFLVTEATPTQAKVARVVRRSYQLLWTELQ